MFFFYNSESQNAGLVYVKKDLKQEMLQYVTDAPKGPLCDTLSHYALSFCDVSLNLLE